MWVVLVFIAILIIIYYGYTVVRSALRRGVPFSRRLSPGGKHVLFALIRGVLSARNVKAESPALRALAQVVPDDEFLERWLEKANTTLCEEHLKMQVALVLSLLSTRVGNLLLLQRWIMLGALTDEERGKEMMLWIVGRGKRHRLTGLASLVQIVTLRVLLNESALAELGYATKREQPVATLAPPRLPLADLTVGSASAPVCIVGSGVGGSVTAGISLAGDELLLIFARNLILFFFSGIDVIVIEKGPQVDPTTNGALNGWGAYERGGSFATEDASMNMLFARCLGGGSLVNWSASFRTPGGWVGGWVMEFFLIFYFFCVPLTNDNQITCWRNGEPSTVLLLQVAKSITRDVTSCGSD